MTILYHEEPTTAEPATKDGTTRPALGIRVVGFEVKAYRFPPLLFISFIELGRVVCVSIEPFSTTASFHCSVNHATDYPDGGHPNTCEHFCT